MANRSASTFRARPSTRPSATFSVEAVTPITLEVALAVQQELQSRLDEADRLRQQQVERARYEAELATAPLSSR